MDPSPIPKSTVFKPAPYQEPTTAAAKLTALPLRPAIKKPRLPQGARILSRRLNVMPHRQPTNLTRQNQHLSPRRRIDVRPSTSLVSILKRAQKLLDKSPTGVASQRLLPTTSLSSQHRLGLGRSDQRGKNRSARAAGVENDSQQIDVRGERFDVLVVGTGGRNIEKALKVAAVFQRKGDCVVRIYTSTVGGIDTYTVADDGDERAGTNDMDDSDVDMGDDAEGSDTRPGQGHDGRTVVKQRARKASSLEVAIRLK